jgi:hypothetical protein
MNSGSKQCRNWLIQPKMQLHRDCPSEIGLIAPTVDTMM